MSNDKTCTCPSGDGSLRHPCPAHPATLATAKHGGCVQLPDSDRARFEAWHREKFKTRWQTGAPARDMHNGVYADNYGPAEQQERWELWQAATAALSAQPSPGGQGALVDTARRNIRQFISRASFSSSVDKQAALSCVDVLEAALAARQPVGEPVVTYCGRRLTPEGTRECWGVLEKGVEDLPPNTKLYAAPAQAVDLGKLLPAVRMLVVSARTSGGTAGRDAHLCEALDRVEALLPKADSQAVGNG